MLSTISEKICVKISLGAKLSSKAFGDPDISLYVVGTFTDKVVVLSLNPSPNPCTSPFLPFFIAHLEQGKLGALNSWCLNKWASTYDDIL